MTKEANCPHGVALDDCLACPITEQEKAIVLDTWQRECDEWNAIKDEIIAQVGGAVAADVTDEQRLRRRGRGEAMTFDSARARRLLR